MSPGQAEVNQGPKVVCIHKTGEEKERWRVEAARVRQEAFLNPTLIHHKVALLPCPRLIIAFCIFTLHFASWIPSGGKREMERWEGKKSEESHKCTFFCSASSFSAALQHVHSSSHRCPSKAASLLFLYPLHLGKITLWIGKGTPGPLTQASPFSPPLLPLPSFWIIDSCCLVIHRLHMPANSSGGGKLPSPATLRSTPNMRTTNHASRRRTGASAQPNTHSSGLG